MADKKPKKLSFRQRIRRDAEVRLDKLALEANEAVARVIGGDAVGASELMKFCAGGATSTLKNQLVTQIANGIEAELEQLYNQQQGLPLNGDTSAENVA